MGKTKKSAPVEGKRKSDRIRAKQAAAGEPKKVVKRSTAPKSKKKPAQNGNNNAEEPKAEATDAQ